MLCPEVWTFPTKPKSTSYKVGKYDKKGIQAVNKFIRGCAFNEMVSIILPGCETVPVPIQQLIESGDYYLIQNLKLSELVRKDFVEAFIKRGKLTGISSEVGIFDSCENVFAITPDGKLVLSISKDLYQILGLEGCPAGLSKRDKDRFEITIDLKSKDFHVQSKFYKRIKNALSNPEIDPFDFKLSWDSIDASICPSSVAKFFNDCGYEVEQHSIQINSTSTSDFKLPNQLFTHVQIDAVLTDAIAEYFATIMLACDTNASHEINTYKPAFDLDLRNDHSTQALILHCKGLLPTDFITKLMEVARLFVDCKSVIMNVNAYEKAPVTRSNGYTVTLINNIKYFLFNT